MTPSLGSTNWSRSGGTALRAPLVVPKPLSREAHTGKVERHGSGQNGFDEEGFGLLGGQERSGSAGGQGHARWLRESTLVWLRVDPRAADPQVRRCASCRPNTESQTRCAGLNFPTCSLGSDLAAHMM